jgi:hypothetical protein
MFLLGTEKSLLRSTYTELASGYTLLLSTDEDCFTITLRESSLNYD